MVDLGDFRRAFCDETRQDYGRTGSQVGRYHLRPLQFLVTRDDGTVSIGLDVGAHTIEFPNMHEAVFKHRFDYHARTLRHGQKRHKRRLHIRRESRIRQRLHISGNDRVHITPCHQTFIRHSDIRAALSQFSDDCLQMIRHHILDENISPGHNSTNHEGSGFDPVRDHVVRNALQLLDPFDLDSVRADALDPCAHFIQKVCQIYDFRLLRRILQNSCTLCQRSCHYDDLSRTYAWEIQIDSRTLQLVGFRIHDPSCQSFFIDGCAQCLKTLQMKFHRPLANSTSARKGDHCATRSQEQSSQHQDRRPHHLHQLIRSLVRQYTASCNIHIIFIQLRIHGCAQTLQKLAHHLYISECRHILDLTFLFR